MKCTAEYFGRGQCQGTLRLRQTVGGIEEYECSLCETEYARPVPRVTVPLTEETERDWTEEPGPWWRRD